ncbi:MAG: photosynthetic complex putative assembly protein PuhB [Pseudooceanicola nanhaiensis]
MSHDDFAIEPIRGLPERPPEGERILWQGRPDWWALTWEALSLPWVAGYFLALALWHFVTLIDTVPLASAFASAFPFVIMGAVVCALLMIVGFVQARATVYTVTTRRVAMRIGAALTVTLNIPFSRIASADLDLRRRGTGSIVLDLEEGQVRLSYFVCWPHVRPWVMRRPCPALRCIPDAERVAALLAEAAETEISRPRVTPIPQAIAAE